MEEGPRLPEIVAALDTATEEFLDHLLDRGLRAIGDDEPMLQTIGAILNRAHSLNGGTPQVMRRLEDVRFKLVLSRRFLRQNGGDPLIASAIKKRTILVNAVRRNLRTHSPP